MRNEDVKKKKKKKKRQKCVKAYKKERVYGICMSLKLQEKKKKVKLMKVVRSLKLIIFAFLFLRGSSSIFQI